MPRVGARRSLSYTEDVGPEDDDDIVVDLGEEREKRGLPNTFEMDDDGETTEVDRKAKRAAGDLDQTEFYANLCDQYEEDVLDGWGEDIVEEVEAAIAERQPWRDRFEMGLEQMGLVESDIDDGPFPGASNAVHPLLIEARTQFWARAMAELWPPEGPCKAKVEGSQNEVQIQRAERVKEYSNYQMMIEDEACVEEFSSLLWDTPFYGSTFFKTYRDPIMDHNVSVYVPADDLIVPAEAKSLRTAPFFCHRMKKWPNEVKQLQLSGHYRDVEIELPSAEEPDDVEQLKNETQDVEPDGDDKSIRHEILEVCMDRELPGEEHKDPETGEVTGLKRPYYFTIDRHSRKVLSIYRGWVQESPKFERDIYIEHFRFAPPGAGGFYGSGLFHLIGGLQTAATGALRVLLDSAASASLSGGFISRHANIKGKRLVFTPGVWEPVDASAEDLNKAFVSPPVKEPSAALFQLLGFLTERGEKYTATTELMTGDSDPKNAPVGTTSQMMEQGGKVMSTIHRMLHNSLGRVLRKRHKLNQLYAPAGGYPYDVDGQQRTVYSDDFAPGVSIIPVSDPNIFSSSQRLQIYQAVLQTVQQTGQGNLKKAVRRFFEALKVPDLDDILPDDVEPMAYDAVGEIQACFLGKPVKVMPEQPHVQHLQVLAAFMQNPQLGGNKAIQQQIGPAILQVMAQHLAYAVATHARGLGAPVGYMDPTTGQVNGAQGTPEQIMAALAQVAPQIATVPGMPAIDDKGGENDAQIKMQELQLKKEEHQMDMEMQVQKHQLDMAMQKNQMDMEVAKQKGQVAMETAQMDGQIKQQQAAQQSQQAHEQMQMEQQMGHQEMQHKAQMGQQKMAIDQQAGQQKIQQGAQVHEQKMAQSQQQQQAQQQQQTQNVDHLHHLRGPPHDGTGGVGGV